MNHIGEHSLLYKGDIIKLHLNEKYFSEQKPHTMAIYGLSTKSKKFRTKSGVGVRSTRDEVVNIYKNYTSFRAYPGWSDNNEKLKNENYFAITYGDAGTELIFKFINNIVTEITIFIDKGC